MRHGGLTLDWDDELGDDGKHLGSSLVEHIEDALHCEESVWVLLLSDALEEDGQVMVVVQLLDLNFPVDAVLRSVLDGNWEISSVVEASELAGRDVSHVECACLGFLRCRSLLWLVEADCLASESLSFLQDS